MIYMIGFSHENYFLKNNYSKITKYNRYLTNKVALSDGVSKMSCFYRMWKLHLASGTDLVRDKRSRENRRREGGAFLDLTL